MQQFALKSTKDNRKISQVISEVLQSLLKTRKKMMKECKDKKDWPLTNELKSKTKGNSLAKDYRK